MQITYQVDQHDGFWAYRLGDVWSETFPSHQHALDAAKSAAEKQQVEGSDAVVTYQHADGSWITEEISGDDRPEADVVDDRRRTH